MPRRLAMPEVSNERWRALTPTARRAVKAVLLVALGLVLVWLFGVWKTSALALAAVVLLLVVPRYSRLGRFGRYVVPAAVLAIAIGYPYYWTHMPELPLFGPFPQVSTLVVMMIFTVMALGLNFVVGYAGLLDLGYVAFYAMGAYMAGWFASNQFSKQNIDFGAVGLYKGDTGFHFSIWLVLPMAGIATALIGVLIGLPTLRLRGDYLAIVTLGFGEILPQIARNGDNLFGTGFNLTNGTGGITPIDGPGFGNWAQAHLGLPAQYLNASNFDAVFFWTALVLVVLTAFLQCAPPRFADRTRLDRDSRRRDGGGRDGRTADAHEDVVVRDGCVLRRRRWRVLRVVQERCVPGRLLLSDLRLHSLHGHPRGDGEHLGRHLRRVLPRLSRSGGPLEYRHADQQQPRHAHRSAEIRVRYLRRDHRDRHALPAGGVDPELDGSPRSCMKACKTSRSTTRSTQVPDVLLQTQLLRKEFGGLVAVDDVDFTVPTGSIVSLIGPNGAGKTTFFNMLTGVYKPTAGRVHFDGEDMTGKPPHAFTQRGIGRTFQNIRLFQNMTALENVLVGMHVRMKGNLFEAILRTPRVKKEEREARVRARELLEFSGLRRKDTQFGRNLSYGDQRRLEVARALATQPKLLLLDEPTAG